MFLTQEELEVRYFSFCEKHNLDPLLSEDEQLDFLLETGNSRLYKTLSGMVYPVAKEKPAPAPSKPQLDIEALMESIEAGDDFIDDNNQPNVVEKTQTKKPKAKKSATKTPVTIEPISLSIDTTPKPHFIVECASLALKSIRNSKVLENGRIQYGFAF